METNNTRLTDNEIIKALECCRNSQGCSKCEFGKQCDGFTIINLALDLINRQKADIENYKQIAENQQSVSMDKEFEIRKLNAEVKRLKYNLEAVLQERADHSEAVKEFAERVISKLYSIPQHHFTFAQVTQDIEKTLKEMGCDSNV